MTVLLADDFASTLVVGSGNWWFRLPASGPSMPVTSGGALLLPFSGYPSTTQLSSYNVWPLRCSIWEWEISDLDTAGIYANLDFFRSTFNVDGSNGIFRWQFRWDPATLGPPETAGTDTAVMLYPSWSTFFPPVAANGSGTPVAFDATDHKWLRIREECHEVFWETSTDGATWNAFYSTTLDSGFIYESDYAMLMGVFAGYAGPATSYLDVGSVQIEKYDACLCPGGQGWRVGRVAAGATPW